MLRLSTCIKSIFMTKYVFIRHAGHGSTKAKINRANYKKIAKKSDRTISKFSASDNNKKRRKWYCTDAPTIGSVNTAKPSHGLQQRAQQLSAVMFEHIYQIFYHGEVDPELSQLGIEISRVKITPDFNNLNIYWNASWNLENESMAESLLEHYKAEIRSVLTHKRIMGRIPPIKFIKDASSARLHLVEEILKTADMGPDHVPTELGIDMKMAPKISLAKKSIQSDVSSLTDTFWKDNMEYEYIKGPVSSQQIVSLNGFISNTSMAEFDRNESHKVNKDDLRECSSEFHIANSLNNSSSKSEQMEAITLSHNIWDINLCTDLYELNHSKLMNQVGQMKNRTKQQQNLSQITSETTDDTEDSHMWSNDSSEMQKIILEKQIKKMVRRNSSEYWQAIEEDSVYHSSADFISSDNEYDETVSEALEDNALEEDFTGNDTDE